MEEIPVQCGAVDPFSFLKECQFNLHLRPSEQSILPKFLSSYTLTSESNI